MEGGTRTIVKRWFHDVLRFVFYLIIGSNDKRTTVVNGCIREDERGLRIILNKEEKSLSLYDQREDINKKKNCKEKL